MAEIAAHHLSFCQRNRATLSRKGSGRGRHGQDRTFSVDAMACTAVIARTFSQTFMPAVCKPGGAHRVHAVGSVQRSGQGFRMAGTAFDDFTCMPLQLDGGHVVIGDICSAFRLNRPFRMGAPVAGLAEQIPMPLAEAVEDPVSIRIIFRKPLVGCTDGRSLDRIIGAVGLQKSDAVLCPDDLVIVHPDVIESIACVARLTCGNCCPWDTLGQISARRKRRGI